MLQRQQTPPLHLRRAGTINHLLHHHFIPLHTSSYLFIPTLTAWLHTAGIIAQPSPPQYMLIHSHLCRRVALVLVLFSSFSSGLYRSRAARRMRILFMAAAGWVEEAAVEDGGRGRWRTLYARVVVGEVADAICTQAEASQEPQDVNVVLVNIKRISDL